MKSTITKDQSGRLHIETDTGYFTVIPADFDKQDVLIEASSLHDYSESADTFSDWVKYL
jgi:hypothetical protein